MLGTNLTSSHTATPSSARSEEHTSELQSRLHLVCRLLLEKKKAPAVLGRDHGPASRPARRPAASSSSTFTTAVSSALSASAQRASRYGAATTPTSLRRCSPHCAEQSPSRLRGIVTVQQVDSPGRVPHEPRAAPRKTLKRSVHPPVAQRLVSGRTRRFFFFHHPAHPAIYTLSLHDALPI